jgi:DNA-binding transcriptional LysR family regulator
MIDELRALAIFAKTIELGSFRNAAKELNLSPSVVSHHIAQLEERLGVTLLYRSTRHLSLTQQGSELFAHAKGMLLEAEAGLNAITHQSPEPSGRLIVTLPSFFTSSKLVKDIAAFAQKFPKVELLLIFSDVKQDLIREGIDLAIRIGDLEDSALKAKRLFDMPRKLVVAPSYMEHRKKPHKPQDLIDWDWIGFKMRPHCRTLVHQSGKTVELEFNPRIVADSVEAVSQLAIAGLGLATPPAFLVSSSLKDKELIEPLSSWTIRPLSVFAVWPPNASKSSLTFRLLEFFESKVT